MAQNVSGEAWSVNALVEAIKDACRADGWTVDHYVTGRAHVSKGGHHFEVYSFDTVSLGMVGCTGYTAGQSPANQPGASVAAYTHVLFTGASILYRIVLSGLSAVILIGRSSGSNIYGNACAFGVMGNKVGSWSGGAFTLAGQHQALAAPYSIWSTASWGCLRINDQWTPNTEYSYLTGRFGADVTLRGKMPGQFNAGILRLPIIAFVQNVTNSSLLHPVGYVQNLYAFRGGDVYLPGETIQILGEPHLCLGEVPGLSTVATLLVRME